MGPCTLQIAGRVVLRSTGAPPEAEYALFESGDIELRASEPGTVRELGYRTSVATARSRLEELGITAKLAEEAAIAMRPALGQMYARGPVVRRVATHFGATEFFEGHEYDPKERVYRGSWLDLPALSADLGVPGAANALQALYLASLLYEVAQDGQVMLHTLEFTKDRRPGERTHRRVPLEQAPGIVEALRKLSWNIPPSAPERDKGASKVEVIDAVRGRASWCADSETRERLSRIERALSERDQPAKGPLADADLWALEKRMSADHVQGVLEQLDAIEKQRGRTPATTYLRARASLMLGKEDPRVIAERVSALALSMSSFSELALLAAQAWMAAGEGRRALPYARDLMENTNLDDELRLRAEMIIAQSGTSSMVPGAPPSAPLEPLSAKPILSIGEAYFGEPEAPEDSAEAVPLLKLSTHPTVRQHYASAQPKAPPDRASSRPSAPPPGAPTPIVPPPRASRPPEGRPPSIAPPARTSNRPRSSAPYSSVAPRDAREDIEEDLPPRGSVAPAASAAPAAPAASPPRGSTRAPQRQSAPPPPAPIAMPTTGLVEMRRHLNSWPDSRAEPDRFEPGDWRNAVDAAPAAESAPDHPDPYMRGASQPPFKTSIPPPNFRTSILPRMEGGAWEAAEMLSLPPGLHGQAAGSDLSLPKSVIEARVQFTHLSRDLGREYRVERGIELRTDAGGLEAMQHYLREAYAGKTVQTETQALEVRKHGAFLSEILARTLGAEWVDIGPSELGYWGMLVPPGTRVWPFARVLRLIQMGHKERDLVSYYLELQARSRR